MLPIWIRWQSRELRDGTYPPDIVRKLDALSEHVNAGPVIDRDAAPEQGESAAEVRAIHRKVLSSLRESVDRVTHMELRDFVANPEPTDVVAHADPLKHQRMVEGLARDLRERVSDHISAGIDSEMYRAWQEAHNGIQVTIRSGDHVEHMTLLDMGPDRELLLVRSRSPEWELHRIAQMARSGEDLRAVHRELTRDESEHYLQADSVDEAVSVGREVIAQKHEAREEIAAMQQRSLDAAQQALTSGELGPTEFAQREQQIRSDTQAIGKIADGLFARGIDPKVVNEVRAMYTGKAEGMLSHHETASGPPSVVVTIEREPLVREAGHNDQTAERDEGAQRAARDAELSRLRASAEQRERALLKQQKQARQREQELAEQQVQAAAQEKKLKEQRGRERQEAQQRKQARQAELDRIRATKDRAERELARVRESMASAPRQQPVTRGPEHSVARGSEHGPVREPERPLAREFEPPMARETDSARGGEPEHVPVREPERGQAREVERDRAVVLKRQIREFGDREHQLILEHQRDAAHEETRDFARVLERAQFEPLQLACEKELVLAREAISTRELELVRTHDLLHEIGEKLSRGREPSREARTPVLERERVPVRELQEHPVREPMAVEWNSPERQLGQLITLVKQANAPTLAIREVITPADVRDSMAREINCPAQYLERLTRSPEYQLWLQLERERQEQARVRGLARGPEARSLGLARTR